MSLDQYNSLMSNLLREKHSLTKLREELEGRKGKLCQCCKRFRHLARNCRNKEGEKCKGNWDTRLQENSQLILQFVVMIQLTSRRILRDQDEVLSLSREDSRITQGGCSERTRWSSLLDCSTTYTSSVVAMLLLIHDHMSFQNILQSHDLVT